MPHCEICNATFEIIWPNTRQNCCSPKCRRRQYYLKNGKTLLRRQRQWNKENRSRRLEIQRRWNNSPSGKLYKSRWAADRISEKCREFLERYHKDKRLRMVMLTRAASRRKLVSSKRDFKCERCGATKTLHCHHIDHDPFNRNLENLQWLCPTCHGFVHSEAFLGE
jgi:hypothetical protein